MANNALQWFTMLTMLTMLYNALQPFKLSVLVMDQCLKLRKSYDIDTILA